VNDIKLVALDLDGTLLTSRKTISRRTHTVLRRAIEQGVKIVLATARPPRSVRTYYTALKLDTPQINYNGALIWDEPNRKVLAHHPVAPALALQVIQFARKLYPELLVSVEILDRWYTDYYSELPEYATETAKQFTPDFVGPIEAFLVVPATKVMLLGHPDWIAELEKAVAHKFAGRLTHTRSDAFLLQIMHSHVNKGGALKWVAQHLDIPREQIMAVGDAPNDADMLEAAGLAVVVGNAWPVVRARVHHVVAANDADGVAEALERFVLK
jgi:Cof subfamily protein (haloacid dehalogenase superfamily)